LKRDRRGAHIERSVSFDPIRSNRAPQRAEVPGPQGRAHDVRAVPESHGAGTCPSPSGSPSGCEEHRAPAALRGRFERWPPFWWLLFFGGAKKSNSRGSAKHVTNLGVKLSRSFLLCSGPWGDPRRASNQGATRNYYSPG